jgi:nitrite reductase (NADH) small subunit
VLIEVGPASEVSRRRRVVVEHEGTPILVLAHDGRFYAFANICIHKQRELSKGVVLNGRMVCPGHQWAFELGTGWESVKEQCQPVYDVVVEDDRVYVDAASRRVQAGPTVATATPESA